MSVLCVCVCVVSLPTQSIDPIAPSNPNSRRHFNVFVVFTFVALWHDMTLKLLTWGWLLALFFVPEGVLRPWSARQKWLVNSGYRKPRRCSHSPAPLTLALHCATTHQVV